MNLRGLRQWFSSPDTARSPWKWRLVWGALFLLVLAGVLAWRVSQPVLGEDVKLENVSRAEAEVIVGTIHDVQRQQRAGHFKRGELMIWLVLTLSSEEVYQVSVASNGDATVSANFTSVAWWAGREHRDYVLKRLPDSWGLSQRRREKVK